MAEYTTPTNLTFSHNIYHNKGIRFIPVPDNCKNLDIADYSVTDNGCLKNVKAASSTGTDTITKVPGGDFGGNGVNYSAFTGNKATGVDTISLENVFSDNTTTACKIHCIGSEKTIDSNLGNTVSVAKEDTVNTIKTVNSCMNVENNQIVEGIHVNGGEVKYFNRYGVSDNTFNGIESIDAQEISFNEPFSIGDIKYTISLSYSTDNGTVTISYRKGETEIANSESRNFNKEIILKNAFETTNNVYIKKLLSVLSDSSTITISDSTQGTIECSIESGYSILNNEQIIKEISKSENIATFILSEQSVDSVTIGNVTYNTN